MYLVIEIQKHGEDLADIVTSHATLNAAESRYHTVLAAAAVSNVPVHAAALISEEGFPMRHECYRHEDGPATAAAFAAEAE